MKRALHSFFSTVFWVTLLIYIGIWCTVSYIGVYVTYVAGPILLISGIMSLLTGEKEKDGGK